MAIDTWLESEYNILARRPDAPELLQRLSERSETYRGQADASLDCRYGEGERERLDIFRSGQPAAPLYVYLHGGYWQRGDKSIYSFLAEGFNAAGIDVAIIGYPLCPTLSMRDLVGKIREALIWLWRNAEDQGLCRERINLSGHSAGGHLTAMGLTLSWPGFDEKLPPDLIKTGIGFSGLYRLEPLRSTTISEALHLSADEIEDLSPVNLEAATDAPLLVVIGGEESSEFFTQADTLIDSWSRPGLTLEKYIEPGVDHLDLVVNLANPASALHRKCLAWLR